jgi:hypothetical protein
MFQSVRQQEVQLQFKFKPERINGWLTKLQLEKQSIGMSKSLIGVPYRLRLLLRQQVFECVLLELIES